MTRASYMSRYCDKVSLIVINVYGAGNCTFHIYCISCHLPHARKVFCAFYVLLLVITFSEWWEYRKDQFCGCFHWQRALFWVSLARTYLVHNVTMFSNTWRDSEASRICQALHSRRRFAVVTYIRTLQRHRSFKLRVDGHKSTKRYLSCLQLISKCKKNHNSNNLRPSWRYHDSGSGAGKTTNDMRAFSMNPKVERKSSCVETFSVSKTSAISQEHPFGSRKWIMLPRTVYISKVNFTNKNINHTWSTNTLTPSEAYMRQ